MADNVLNRVIALGVFIVSLVVYILTLSTTVVFWDVGEFCAAAYLLQVPHPPGSPLFLLLGRVMAMVPFTADIAARIHTMSAVSAALGISFLYLISVKLIGRFRGKPGSLYDKVVVYGSSIVGALSLAFTTTYWANAVEAEVYGVSMLFVSFIIWLTLRWWERADEPHNEKYMLLIAYLIGLSTGVHLLSLLAIFTVILIVFFRRYEVNRRNLFRLGLITVGIFFVIYPGIVQYLPSMLDGEFKGVKSDLLPLIPLIVILAAAYGVYRTMRTKHWLLHVACLAFLFIILGYTTYIGVIIRSNVPNLPMNENNPSNLERLTSYLGREQYGDTPLLKGESWDNQLNGFREKLFPRRYSQEAMHEATRVNYSSDWDFLWRYQVNHMFIRYLLWNYVGIEGDWQDAGVDWSSTWGIPLLVGLLGLYYHARRDWRNAMAMIVLFLVMGLIFALYANMQEPQPRERDYFYVGAFFVFSFWIGLGVLGIIDTLREKLRKETLALTAAGGVLVLGMVVIPVNLIRINWFEHDRSNNYLAWDYSYNMLQSCEQDAILFTNGDNDTFPLWYLQDVEGVRRDIRIVNLSLVNTPWYIHQLKHNTPHGAKKVPVSLSDQQIERIQPSLWKPRQLELRVPREVYEQYGVTDTAVINQGKILYTLNGIQIRPDVRVLRVQDIMVRDIITANNWQQPVYFAVTVSPDSKVGFDNYLWMRGLAWRLKPVQTLAREGGIDPEIKKANLMAVNVTPSKTPQYGYLFRHLNDPKVSYDENAQRLLMNYRAAFMRLAYYYLQAARDMPAAKLTMARLEDLMPIALLPIRDWRFTAGIMDLYGQIGDSARFEAYAADVEAKALELINSNRVDPNDNPYGVLLQIYETRKDYRAAIDLLNRAAILYPNDPQLKARIQFYERLLQKTPPVDSATAKF